MRARTFLNVLPQLSPQASQHHLTTAIRNARHCATPRTPLSDWQATGCALCVCVC
jgi:hypothetical protein